MSSTQRTRRLCWSTEKCTCRVYCRRSRHDEQQRDRGRVLVFTVHSATHLALSTSQSHGHHNNNKELALWHSHHPAWMGVSHRWVPVKTHSTPVLPKREEAVGCSTSHNHEPNGSATVQQETVHQCQQLNLFRFDSKIWFYSVWPKELNFFWLGLTELDPFLEYDSENWNFFLGFLHVYFFSKMMQRIEPFFLWIWRKELNLFSLNVTSRIGTFLNMTQRPEGRLDDVESSMTQPLCWIFTRASETCSAGSFVRLEMKTTCWSTMKWIAWTRNGVERRLDEMQNSGTRLVRLRSLRSACTVERSATNPKEHTLRDEYLMCVVHRTFDGGNGLGRVVEVWPGAEAKKALASARTPSKRWQKLNPQTQEGICAWWIFLHQKGEWSVVCSGDERILTVYAYGWWSTAGQCVSEQELLCKKSVTVEPCRWSSSAKPSCENETFRMNGPCADQWPTAVWNGAQFRWRFDVWTVWTQYVSMSGHISDQSSQGPTRDVQQQQSTNSWSARRARWRWWKAASNGAWTVMSNVK